MAKPVWSDSQVINQLDSGYHWSGSNWTYGFPANASWFPYAEKNGFSALGAAQQTAATLAIKLWDDLIAPDFTLAANGATATVKFSNTTSNIGYAHAYYPGGWSGAGSVWFNSNYGANSGTNNLVTPTVGNWGFATYVHEIGHALGLDHPGDYNGGSPTYANDALYAQDSQMYTLMSYFDADETGADWYASDGRWYYAQTPMLHDVMAIQAIYGAETTTRTGNTTYGFNANADVWLYDFTQNRHPVLTIYDAGGIDTLDLSGWSYSCTINLAPGSYSHCDMMTYNVAIAAGTFIENGIGGGGADVLNGNDLANVLTGLAGNDTISGLAGNDSLYGGDGNDTLTGGAGDDFIDGGAGTDSCVFSGAYTFYTASWDAATSCYLVVDTRSGSPDGTDRVKNVESFVFSDATIAVANLLSALNSRIYGTNGDDILTGTAADDEVYGLEGADTLYGMAGNDVLDGGAGNDILVGGQGVDILTGGADADLFLFADGHVNMVERDRVTDFAIGEDKIDLSQIDANRLTGSSDHFRFLGTGALDGQAGALRYGYDAARNITNLRGDTDGDGLGDFIIEFVGRKDFAASDFTADSLVLVQATGLTLVGDSSANTLIGTAFGDTLRGMGGDDTLNGLDGDDTLIGGTGVDILTGGAGRDVFVFAAGDVSMLERDRVADFVVGQDKIDLSGIDANTLTPSKDEFRFLGTAPLDGQPGALRYGYDSARNITNLRGDVDGDGIGDFIIEFVGQKSFTIADFVGAALAQIGGLTLLGDSSSNMLSGSAYDDILWGMGGNDVLNGFGGDDTLVGGTGVDTLTGGAGSDTFVFANGDVSMAERDRVTDFVAGVDSIDLTGFDADPLTPEKDPFRFLGSAALDGQPGALRYGYDSDRNITNLRGDIDGDGLGDFIIEFVGRIDFVAADFIL